MDVGTQALASLVVARMLVPRASWRAWAIIVVAGTISNIDFISSMMSPSVYLEWHRTYAHSIVVSSIVSVSLSAAYIFAVSEPTEAQSRGSISPKFSRSTFFVAAILAGLLHLALDAAQSPGTMIFWPVSRLRIALDWLPRVDPWIIAILLAALLLPELTRLVSDEIGAKVLGPSGRIGAILGLVVLALYVGMRADLHSSAIATFRNRIYDSGQPHRVAAYADAASPFVWHGIVETERALNQPIYTTFTSSQFDVDNGETLFKPEPSPILAQAQQTEAATQFLAIAQFPKADVEQSPDGYRVEIRDLRYVATGEKKEIRARVDLDATGKVLNDELVWARDTVQP